MKEKRLSLYDKLPEIYRIKDDEQQPAGQLKSYIALLEEAFGAIQENIELFYHDLFIETCQDWVIPYIGDLLGNSHLNGDPRTLRAEVADVIALRRRKGTLLAIERLTYDLTRWGVHCVELRENLVWNQHLNHQRPDLGGNPPHSLQNFIINNKSNALRAVIRGGTVNLRDPVLLSLLKTPFDPFSYLADLKPSTFGSINPNLPNLAIFLWRLKTYQVQRSKPVIIINQNAAAAGDEAKFIVRIQVHPLGEPVMLFNTHRFPVSEKDKPILTPIDTLTQIDRTPGPILRARLTTGTPAANSNEYVAITKYNETTFTTTESLKKRNVGLQLHIPQSLFQDQDDKWSSIRGSDLCAWEKGLSPPLKNREIVIDPVIGRIVIGVDTIEKADALDNHLLVTYTYGAVGPVGAHPTARFPLSEGFVDNTVSIEVNLHQNKTLKDALNNIENSLSKIIVEIKDSMTHELDIGSVLGAFVENSNSSLRINNSLVIKADANQRPVIKLTKPLRFRPTRVRGTNEEEQKQLDKTISNLNVRLEGLYLTRAQSFPPDEPLIARLALNSLEIVNCTLDPGGFRKLDGTRAPIHQSIEFDPHYGFEKAVDEEAFKETPKVILQHTITGPLFIEEEEYFLSLSDSILDAGNGDDENHSNVPYVLSGSRLNSSGSWGPATEVYNTTIFGRMRVKSINGRGGIWKNALEVFNNQRGCIKFSYFSGSGDRLPQNHGCVNGMQARLRFVGTTFGHQAYGQLAHQTDFRIKERGPDENEMGAYGFLQEAHKWRNIQIRFREFMPIGVRSMLITVT